METTVVALCLDSLFNYGIQKEKINIYSQKSKVKRTATPVAVLALCEIPRSPYQVFYCIKKRQTLNDC